MIFRGLTGVSDSGNGVTCILLFVEKEDFLVGRDAEATVGFVVFASFFDVIFFICTADFLDLLGPFLLSAGFDPSSKSSKNKTVSFKIVEQLSIFSKS
jgi:hypothetical protein